MTAAIEALDLTRRFGDFVAVDGVRFTVATGEIFGFLGPNGAGKTTTIKMLTGLLRPSSGSVGSLVPSDNSHLARIEENERPSFHRKMSPPSGAWAATRYGVSGW